MTEPNSPKLLPVLFIVLGIGWVNFYPTVAQDRCISHPLPPDVVDKMVAAADATLSQNERNNCLVNENKDETSDSDTSQLNEEISRLRQELQTGLDTMKQELEFLRLKMDNLVLSQETKTHCESDIIRMLEDLKEELRNMTEQNDNADSVKCLRPRDCSELHQHGENESGVYTIFLAGAEGEGVRVFCDMSGPEGGWTVVLSRKPLEVQVNFSRGWQQYKEGFGDPETEHWIGNEALYKLTSAQNQQLKVEMEDWDRNKRYARYNMFLVDHERNNYRLHVGGYSGDAGDALRDHNDIDFSTWEMDNDKAPGNCASQLVAGFWYNACFYASPTNRLLSKQKTYDGINWLPWYGDATTLKSTTWKVKPRNLPRV